MKRKITSEILAKVYKADTGKLIAVLTRDGIILL